MAPRSAPRTSMRRLAACGCTRAVLIYAALWGDPDVAPSCTYGVDPRSRAVCARRLTNANAKANTAPRTGTRMAAANANHVRKWNPRAAPVAKTATTPAGHRRRTAPSSAFNCIISGSPHKSQVRMKVPLPLTLSPWTPYACGAYGDRNTYYAPGQGATDGAMRRSNASTGSLTHPGCLGPATLKMCGRRWSRLRRTLMASADPVPRTRSPTGVRGRGGAALPRLLAGPGSRTPGRARGPAAWWPPVWRRAVGRDRRRPSVRGRRRSCALLHSSPRPADQAMAAVVARSATERLLFGRVRRGRRLASP